MRKLTTAFVAIFLLNVTAFAGPGKRPPRDPLSATTAEELARKTVQQEIRRSMRSSEDARRSRSDEDASSKAGTSFYEGTWEPSSRDPVDAGEYTAKDVEYSAAAEEKKPTVVANPKADEGKDKPGFFSKAGSAVTGFLGGTWDYIKTHKAMIGGAVAGAVIGGLYAGPIGALLGAFVGGFGGWWVGEGLG